MLQGRRPVRYASRALLSRRIKQALDEFMSFVGLASVEDLVRIARVRGHLEGLRSRVSRYPATTRSLHDSSCLAIGTSSISQVS